MVKNLIFKKGNIFIAILVGIVSLLLSDQAYSQNIEIRGVYGHPKPFWDKGIRLSTLGVNAVFVHRGSIDHDLVSRAKADGLRVFSEFPTLNGKNYVESHPEAWPINEKGEKVEAATWFMGVCPTDTGFRQYRFRQLKELLQSYDIDGVWMDYMHWHAQFEDPEPILPETCFCDQCLNNFSAHEDIKIPGKTTAEKAQWILAEKDKSWRDWRCQAIYNWTYQMKAIIKAVQPDVLLGLYHCPWNDDEFDGARRRILGLDYDILKKTIDVFSPMVYHGRMERDPEWVAQNIEWFSERLNIQRGSGPKIWPIVQAYDDPEEISNEEFEKVLRGGLSGGSSGVMMFTTHAVAEDESKTQVIKKVYLELAEKNKQVAD